MKKIISILMSILLIACSFAACSKERTVDFDNIDFTAAIQNQTNLKILTFNVAAPWGNALKGTSSSKRVERFANIVKFTQADSVGTQEINEKWVNKLEELMPQYASYGIERGGDSSKKKSEMNAIFYLKDKYNLIDSGTFWLTETPEKESRSDGAGCNRICSWVVLENKSSKKQYIHLNTHLDNKSEEAATFGAKVIAEQLKSIQTKYSYIPVVITGDLNQTSSGDAYKTIINAGFTESFSALNKDPKATYHDWGKISEEELAKQKPIDFIFVSKDSTNGFTSCAVVDGTPDGKMISDHYGVTATIALNQEEQQ